MSIFDSFLLKRTKQSVLVFLGNPVELRIARPIFSMRFNLLCTISKQLNAANNLL